jgi:hypothetical protein
MYPGMEHDEDRRASMEAAALARRKP